MTLNESMYLFVRAHYRRRLKLLLVFVFYLNRFVFDIAFATGLR